MTFEEKLDDVVARGDFTHLSVIASQNQKGKFLATFAPAKAFGIVTGEGKTPAAAMLAALNNAPLARKTRAGRDAKPGTETPADDIDFG